MITPLQADLLRAALLQGEEAVRAYERWIGGVDLERLDHDSTRLLPLVHANLRKKIELPGKLAGMQRNTWSRNQVLLKSVSRAWRDLGDAGIPRMLLRGMAIVLSTYEDWGLRPMADAHILVQTDAHDETCAVLRRTGWTAVGTPRLEWPSLWCDSAGQRLKLHIKSIQEASEDFEAALWTHRVKAEDFDMPCREHLLMQTMTCGQFSPRGHAIRWVADAYWMLRRGVDMNAIHELLPRSGLDVGWVEGLADMESIGIGLEMFGHAQHAPPEDVREAFRTLRRRHARFGEIVRAWPVCRERKDRAAFLRSVFHLPDDADLLRFAVGAAWKRMR